MLGLKMIYVRCIKCSYKNVAKDIRLLDIYLFIYLFIYTIFKEVYTLAEIAILPSGPL